MSRDRASPPRDDAEMEQLLNAARPVAGATFRGDVRQRLTEPHQHPRPERLRLLIGAYAGSGGLLLAVVALGIAGAGPFGAG